MDQQALCSVVVINFNNGKYFERCYGALLRNSRVKEVIVVDDASTDNSVEIFEPYPVKVVRNPKNLGPVASRNVGAREATGKYILFLDADAELSQHYIPILVNFFERHPEAGGVSGRVRAEDGRRMRYNFGYDPSYVRDLLDGFFTHVIARIAPHEKLKKLWVPLARPFTLNFVGDETIRKVDWVVEMAFMTRRDIFQKLGGFDEGLYMFFEGPEYCKRVRNAGYTIYYIPGAALRHLGGHSHSSRERAMRFQQSRLHYYQKHPKIF